VNICGDGLPCVACGQDCDDANGVDGDGCSNACKFEVAYAFVTSGVWTGAALGGVIGADMKCNTAANGSELLKGRKFHAWLSKSDEDAAVHVGPGALKLVRTDGEVVAESTKGLIDGELTAPIDHDEFGNLVAPQSPCMTEANQVWTGTHAGGTKALELCSNWSMVGPTGRLGNFSEINSTWTDCRIDGCGVLKAHLYCIEVVDP
jgi:cysteine-rich repeat protein